MRQGVDPRARSQPERIVPICRKPGVTAAKGRAAGDAARGSLLQLLLHRARGTPGTAGPTRGHAGAVSRNSRIAKATSTITAVQITTIMVG